MSALLVLAALATLVGLITATYLLRCFHKSTNGLCTSLKNLEGKTTIVTGGTTGMGLEIAKDFARRGARVIIACPFHEEGLNAQKNIVQETGNSQIIFKHLDLGSLHSVREFASDILKSEDRLDLLMNNAGVGMPKNFITKDGMNFIVQVNYYGHFLLTILLLPLLKKTGRPSEPTRVVCTSSTLHYFGGIDPNSGKSSLGPLISYNNSKFCMIPFCRELTRRLKGAPVIVNSADPGSVGTGIFESVNKLFGAFVTVVYCFLFKTPKEGAQTALHVALDDRVALVSGELFKDCRITRAKFSAYKDGTAKTLWEQSVRLVKLSEEELEKSFN